MKIAQNNSETELNQHANEQMISKIDQQTAFVHRTSSPRQKTQTSQKERKNRKMTETILPLDQNEKSKHRESSRLRSQARKNYKTFVPLSKILKKVEFQK